MPEDSIHRPGDEILNRYMPDATGEEREIARENLRAFAAVAMGIAKRRALEERESIRENEEPALKSIRRF